MIVGANAAVRRQPITVLGRLGPHLTSAFAVMCPFAIVPGHCRNLSEHFVGGHRGPADGDFGHYTAHPGTPQTPIDFLRGEVVEICGALALGGTLRGRASAPAGLLLGFGPVGEGE